HLDLTEKSAEPDAKEPAHEAVKETHLGPSLRHAAASLLEMIPEPDEVDVVDLGKPREDRLVVVVGDDPDLERPPLPHGGCERRLIVELPPRAVLEVGVLGEVIDHVDSDPWDRQAEV